MSQIIFDSGRELRTCRSFKIELTEPVTYCSRFTQRGEPTKNLEDWELMEYAKSITPYIIEFQRKAGFLGAPDEKEVIVREAMPKDREGNITYDP